MNDHAMRPRSPARLAWLAPTTTIAAVVMLLGFVVLSLRGCRHQQAHTYSFGEWQAAPATVATKAQFGAAHTALASQLESMGFVEDRAYVQGSFGGGGVHAPGRVQHMYVRMVDETALLLLTEELGGDEVGLWTTLSYQAAGPRAQVESTAAKIDQLRLDLEAWLAAYERDHPMPPLEESPLTR